MKLVIKNLGAIKKKSEIDLTKRFYTFVGYNNSGKTYVSQVIWYLFSKFPEDFFKEFKLPENIITQQDIDENFENFEFDIRTVLPQFQSIIKAESLDLLGLPNNENIFIELLKNIDLIYYSVSCITTDIIEIKDYLKIFKDKNSAIIKIKIENTEKVISWKDFAKTNRQHFNLISVNSSMKIDKDRVLKHIKDVLVKMIFDIYFTSILLENIVFLPASRSTLPSYYKYILEGYYDERNQIGKILRLTFKDGKDEITYLTKRRHILAIDILLKKLNDLSSKSPVKPFYTDLITDLENLMQGSIGVENVEGIANSEFGFKVDSKTTLEMYQTSTSVNQLTLLYLYLKYWTEESNNFLIIDEPEENLHPENQIKLLDILVKFANRNNNRVLFTTHSPLMAEAVNNHAHITLLRERGEDVEKIIKDHHLTISPNNSANDTLKHSDYATYFFNGEAIKEYPMTDFGVFFRDFKEAEDKVRTTANTLKEYIYNSQHKKENGEKLSE